MATFPTAPLPTNVSIKSINQVTTSTFSNYNTEKKSNGAQRWEFTLDFPKTDFANGKSLFAFINTHRGSLETFNFNLPSPIDNTTGTHLGAFNVITGPSTGSTFNIGGLVQGTGRLKAGDLLQFSNHTKLYMITSDVDADASGNGVLNIMPPVLVSVTPNTTTGSTVKPSILCRFTNDMPSVLIDNNTHYVVRSLKLLEHFNVPTGVV